MKTLKIMCIGIASLISTTSFALLSYNPTDLKTFESTNQCSNCDFSDLNWWNGNDGATLNHSEAIINGSNFSGDDIENFNLSGSQGANSIFTNVYNVESSETDFSGANLKGADFSGSSLENSNFSHADLTGASFTNSDLMDANFSSAIGANLTNAKTICGATMPDGSIGKCS